MVNKADKSLRLVDISLVEINLRDKLLSLLWQHIVDSALAVQARSPFSVLLQQYEQQQVFSALEPDIAPETTVLRRRPPKTLLEHPPKRTTFYMLLGRRKLTKCV